MTDCRSVNSFVEYHEPFTFPKTILGRRRGNFACTSRWSCVNLGSRDSNGRGRLDLGGTLVGTDGVQGLDLAETVA